MTPLQMAMVVAGIANGGTVMRPYVVDKITAPGGGTVFTHPPAHAVEGDLARDRRDAHVDDGEGGRSPERELLLRSRGSRSPARRAPRKPGSAT